MNTKIINIEKVEYWYRKILPMQLQSNLDISNSDISNSANLETSLLMQNTF